MLPEAALHFEEVTVHPPWCIPHDAFPTDEDSDTRNLSCACLSCNCGWAGATETGHHVAGTITVLLVDSCLTVILTGCLARPTSGSLSFSN